MDPAVVSVMTFLIDEVKEARGRAMSATVEVQLHALLSHSSRRTRKLERVANAFSQLDAETKPTSSN